VNDLTSTKIDFLKKIGSDKVGHSGQTLLEHLIGTSTRLKEQGCPEYMQDAGYFTLCMELFILCQRVGWLKIGRLSKI